MKPLPLALLLALTACENPITHFTEPDKGETITIDCGTLDFTDNNGEMRDTLVVKGGKCGQAHD